ncbi:MAG: HPF/RaiA family ribosome-associated protein [Pseudoxanthomonas suwonensis]|nr:HPF/RaiA family ribosome-associated protein [Pseudoxanthomonas suwonensis]
MKIQLNTDNNVQGDASLQRHAEETVTSILERFADRITRVEVHVHDDNGRDRTGEGLDKHCTIEARLNNMQPLTASDSANDVSSAVTGAARKLQRVIETAVGKLSTH